MMIGEESSSEAVTTLVACDPTLFEEHATPINETTNIIWVPCNIAHPASSSNSHTRSCTREPSQGASTAAICQCNYLSFASQIPNDSIPRTTCSSKHILYLLIPCDGGDFIEFSAPLSRGRGVWLAWVLQVPDVHLSLRHLSMM